MTRSRVVVLGLGAAIAFQLIVLVGMVVHATLPLWTGTEIRVRTLPVDPRSLFRGNYVRLSYELGTLPMDALWEDGEVRYGEVVHVRLERSEGGEYAYAGVSLDPPSEGVFLRGRVVGFLREYQWVRYGIEAFFAPKEKALALEKDLRNGGIAVLMVAGNGRAALKDVIPGVSAHQSRETDSDTQ